MIKNEDVRIYPVESYCFDVRTSFGSVIVKVQPTEWDRPSQISMEGNEYAEMALRRYFESATGMRGGGLNVKMDTPENINHCLLSAGDEIEGFSVLRGFVPTEPIGIVAESAYVEKIASEVGISTDEAERRWKKARKITEDQAGLSEDDGDKYWAYVTGVFKKSMGVTELVSESSWVEIYNKLIGV